MCLGHDLGASRSCLCPHVWSLCGRTIGRVLLRSGSPARWLFLPSRSGQWLQPPVSQYQPVSVTRVRHGRSAWCQRARVDDATGRGSHRFRWASDTNQMPLDFSSATRVRRARSRGEAIVAGGVRSARSCTINERRAFSSTHRSASPHSDPATVCGAGAARGVWPHRRTVRWKEQTRCQERAFCSC